MLKNGNIFFKKKILIYGLGKSGLSTYRCLNQTIVKFFYMMIKKNLLKIQNKKKIN